MSSPTLQKIPNMLNNIHISRLIHRTTQLLEQLHRLSTTNYHRARILLMGPARNALVISRELLELIGRQREWRPLQKSTWEQAQIEYRDIWLRMRQLGNFNALKSKLAEFSWKEVGQGALIMGEITSIYYVGKLLAISTKKTLGLVLPHKN